MRNFTKSRDRDLYATQNGAKDTLSDNGNNFKIILLIRRFIKCGVTDSILAQRDELCSRGYKVEIVQWRDPIRWAKKLLINKNIAGQHYISHDLASDIMITIMNNLGLTLSATLFSHSEYFRDYKNRKGIIKGRVLEFLQSRVYSLCPFSIAVPSPTHKDSISKHLKMIGIDKKVLILPHLISTNLAYNLRSRKKRYFFIISDSWDKNKKTDLSCIVVNKMSKALEKQSVALTRKPLGKNYSQIKFEYYREDKEIQQKFQESEIFLSLSVSESFHYTLLYGLVNGLKCIVSDIPCHRWLISFFTEELETELIPMRIIEKKEDAIIEFINKKRPHTRPVKAPYGYKKYKEYAKKCYDEYLYEVMTEFY